MFKRLKTISKVTLEVMQNNPATRNSDRKLWLEVAKELNPGVDVATLPFCEVVTSPLIPNYESVSRSARMIRRTHEELRGTEAVQKERDNNEAIYNFVFKRKITE